VFYIGFVENSGSGGVLWFGTLIADILSKNKIIKF